MARVFYRVTVCAVLVTTLAWPAIAQLRTADRVNTESFRRSFERSERGAVERQDRLNLQRERPELGGRRGGGNETNQNPIDLCRENRNLPQCEILGR